ncbi:hypothetical protein ACLESO_25560 [Pyxidicoccus sp. 3LG]
MAMFEKKPSMVTTTVLALAVAGAAFADPNEYRHEKTQDRAEFYRDMQLGIQEEGIRREIARRLDAEADSARKQGARYGGVLYRIDVYRDALTGQAVQGHPTLVNMHGYGATPEAALIQGFEARAYRPDSPRGLAVAFDSESSGYLFAPINGSQPFRYSKFLGADAKALRQKADLLLRAANRKSMAGLVGIAGNSIPLTNESTRLDVLTPPKPSKAQLESQQRRSEAQNVQAQQLAEQVRQYREAQQHEDGDAAERFEHESRARNEHGDSDDDTVQEQPKTAEKDKPKTAEKEKPRKDGSQGNGERGNRGSQDRRDKSSRSERVGTNRPL